MVTSLDTIKQVGADVARANGARLAILFGSYARGTATKRSDVDFIFVEETSERFLKRLDRYLMPLSDRLDAAVEVLVYTPEEFERMKDKPFIRQALREGVVVYESGEA